MKIEPDYRRTLVFWTIFTTLLVSYLWVWSSSRDREREKHYYEDYSVIHKGMTNQEVRSILLTSKGMVFYGTGWMSSGSTEEYIEPDSALIPGGRVVVDFDEYPRVTRVRAHKPTIREIWTHWMNQLGL